MNNRAWLWATSKDERRRNGPRAVEDATKACQLTAWNNPTCLDTLAAAYAEVGKFDDAVVWQSKAVAFWRDHAKLLHEGQSRLDLYRRRQPYRR